MMDFGLNTVVQGKRIVEEFVTKELYPTDTPEFTVQSLAFSTMTIDEDWRGFYTTDLPDDMLYEVIQLRGEEPTIHPYTKADF